MDHRFDVMENIDDDYWLEQDKKKTSSLAPNVALSLSKCSCHE